MAIRLAVNHSNTKHRFVSTIEVTLTLAGQAQPEAKTSKLGHRLWDITSPVGTTFELRMFIPAPVGSGLGKPLLNLLQLLQVSTLPKGGTSITPKSPKSDPCPDRFNPLLSGQLVGAGAGRRFEINVDLTFLDLTDYYQAKTGRLTEYLKMPQTNPAVQPTQPKPPAEPAHYGVRLRILEFTGGHPACWAVLIPPRVKPESDRIGAVLFFRPALAGYTNTDDLGIHEMVRYFGDPTPEDTPFFSQPQPVVWNPLPQCAFEKQVAHANKCAIFVHPFPHRTDYGNVPSRFPELLASLCKILWADGTIGASVCSDLRLSRIAVSGFSFGGEPALASLNSRPEKIDELDLFDSNKTGANIGAIEGWFRRKGKKLRMFGGGMQHAPMLAIAKTLASPDATVRPPIRAGWDSSSFIYPIAVRCAAIRAIQVLSSPTDPSPSALTIKSGMFSNGSDGHGGIKLEAHTPKGTRVNGVVNDCIAEEAAALVLILTNRQSFGTKLTKDKILPNGKKMPAGTIELPTKPPTFILEKDQLKVPVRSAAELQFNVRLLATLTMNMRHQWAALGGDDSKLNTNRGVNFIGYLQQAMASSGFF
jgi:hypothetical protein